jgi:hypothetical protein
VPFGGDCQSMPTAACSKTRILIMACLHRYGRTA